MDTLRKIPAVLRYLCAEPLLEDLTPDIDQHLDGFSWLMVGGESGCGTDNHRPFNMQWARNLRDLCKHHSIPFYFKQISARWTQTGATIDGKKQLEFPAALHTYKPAPKVRVPGQVQLLDSDLNVI